MLYYKSWVSEQETDLNQFYGNIYRLSSLLFQPLDVLKALFNFLQIKWMTWCCSICMHAYMFLLVPKTNHENNGKSVQFKIVITRSVPTYTTHMRKLSVFWYTLTKTNWHLYNQPPTTPPNLLLLMHVINFSIICYYQR